MKSKRTNDLLLAAGVGLGAWTLYRIARRASAYSFRGKVVLITGGSRGLGLVLARQFAADGARVVICARIEDELERARIDLADRGSSVLSLLCDISDEDQVRTMIHLVTAHFGDIDVLVNNAGFISVGPNESMTRADFKRAMAINFWGAYNTVQAVLPEMRKRGQGRIVNIASIGGKVPLPHLLPYTASKFALVGYSAGLRAELAREGIVVTTICPGLTRTGSPRNAIFKGQHRLEYAWFSIGDSLPLLSQSAERAAGEILDACRYGEAERILSLPAQVLAMLYGIAPGLMTDVAALINRLLPAPGGMGTLGITGAHSESTASPSTLTVLNEQAAEHNNQYQTS